MDDKSPAAEAAHARMATLEEAIDHIRRKLGMPTYAEPQAIAVEVEIRVESERLAKNGILALSKEVTELQGKLERLSTVCTAAKELREAVLNLVVNPEDVVCGAADRVARACAAVRDLPSVVPSHG